MAFAKAPALTPGRFADDGLDSRLRGNDRVWERTRAKDGPNAVRPYSK